MFVPMTKKLLLAIIVIAAFAGSSLLLPFGIVEAVGSFLQVKHAQVLTDSSEVEKAIFNTKSNIPTDGSGGAFGYGYISGAGLEAIAVTTTHAGVLDSVAQSDPSDPVWHNHYVALQQLDDDDKCPGLEVRDISFEEPGDVDVTHKIVAMEDVPYYFAGTHSLSGDPVSFLADENIGAAVSFTINPVDGTGATSVTDIQAVCINDVAFVEEDDLKVRKVNKIL
jgi:hypothetical protein